jgi:hypothetical protein
MRLFGGLFWMEDWIPVEIVPLDDEAGMPLTYRTMGTLHRELPELRQEPLQNSGLDCFIRPESRPFGAFLKGVGHVEVT